VVCVELALDAVAVLGRGAVVSGGLNPRLNGAS
jgi:hypothetical protein